MKVPKKVKVFGRIYAVIHDNAVVDSHDCYGLVHHETERVFLRKRGDDFSEEKEASTFMHELFHILDENLRTELTEEQVNLLSVGFFTAVQDNKLNFLSSM